MSRLALVTGASSGIGRAFAERLAADGCDLVVVGRRRGRLDELAAAHPGVEVRTVVADLSTDDGVDAVAEVCATEPLTMLVNNAGVAHYMSLAQLPAALARELVHVKVVAPTMLTRAAVAGMQARGAGTIISVAGMIAFSGPAKQPQLPRRAVYAGTLALLVAMSQALHVELAAWRTAPCWMPSSRPTSPRSARRARSSPRATRPGDLGYRQLRSGRADSDADRHSRAVRTTADGRVLGELADHPQSVTVLGSPGSSGLRPPGARSRPGGAADGGALRPPVVGHLAVHGVAASPDTHPAVPGAVEHGVGRQLVHDENEINNPAGRHARLRDVRGDCRPQHLQRVPVEGLLHDRGDLAGPGTGTRGSGGSPARQTALRRWPTGGAVPGHRLAPGQHRQPGRRHGRPLIPVKTGIGSSSPELSGRDRTRRLLNRIPTVRQPRDEGAAPGRDGRVWRPPSPRHRFEVVARFRRDRPVLRRMLCGFCSQRGRPGRIARRSTGAGSAG
jgi:short-subunit dehydrogenase